jgi:hypothetical protein
MSNEQLFFRDQVPGAGPSQARHPVAHGQRSHVRQDLDKNGHGRELQHRGDLLQDRRPRQVQVRARLQGGRRLPVHLRRQWEVERRGAPVRL